FTVPAGVGLLSARNAVGGTRTRTKRESCRAVVSARHCILAGLCKGACAPGGDLREPRPNRRRGGATLASAFEPRSGGSVASGRRHGRATAARRVRNATRGRTIRVR